MWQRKREQGLSGREVFVPQNYGWVRKRRSTGLKRQRSWAASASNFTSSPCAAWAPAMPSASAPRQPDHRGEENPSGTAAYRNRPSDRIPVALGFKSEYCTPASGNERAECKANSAGACVPPADSPNAAPPGRPEGVRRRSGPIVRTLAPANHLVDETLFFLYSLVFDGFTEVWVMASRGLGTCALVVK
jgi:hypothetical protein